MGGQVTPQPACRAVIAAALLVAGCNQLTGVGDLRVARCGTDAGADAGPCETRQGELNQQDGGAPREPELGNGRGASGGASGAAGNGGAGGRDLDGNVPAAQSCEPGSQLQCLGPGGCPGSQRCSDDGASASACECGAAALALAESSVGAACESDDDCSPGLACTSSQASSGPFLGGGVQGGYCSRPCGTDSDCASSDPGALCVRHEGGPPFCFQQCGLATRSFPDQCNGRSELLCLPLSGGQRGYCAPACQTDDDCAPRACDLATGLCSDEANDGLPVGSACSADEQCAAGLCLTLPGQTPACTGLCTLGSAAGCGFAEEDPSRSAACTNDSAGDFGLGLAAGVGLCQELCNVDEDCFQAELGWGCTPWADAADEERFGSVGFCEVLVSATQSDPACNDSCLFAGNGSCDDETSFLPLCEQGTDCSDCGPG